MDMGGNFEILAFEMGKEKTDPSYARLRIAASSKDNSAINIVRTPPAWCPPA